MDVLKYYRRRKSGSSINLENLLKLKLPFDYLGFGISYDPEDIVAAFTTEPYRIGVERNGEILAVRFSEIANANYYRLDFGDEMYEEPIVLIADNNIPEGGIYLDTRDGQIYNLANEPSNVPKEERVILKESFAKFLEEMSLYRLSNFDSSYYDLMDLNIPNNKDDIKLPWEP